jgi:hypothetical protein
MAKPIISADSHITEPADTYTARIETRFRDRAPHVVRDPQRGDLSLAKILSDSLRSTELSTGPRPRAWLEVERPASLDRRPCTVTPES